MLQRWICKNQIQRRCGQVTWDGYPSQSCRRPARKRVSKLQQFETYEEVPQAEAEGQEIISSRFVDKWEESGEKRSRLVSRGYESSQADPASLFAATPSVVATRNCARVEIGTGRGNGSGAHISGAFLHALLEKHFFVTPPAEYRKPGVVWKIKRHLYGDKRAPREWQDHFEKTMLELGFERLESQPGCFGEEGSLTQGHDHCGCACGPSPECWEAKTSRQLLCAT